MSRDALLCLNGCFFKLFLWCLEQPLGIIIENWLGHQLASPWKESFQWFSFSLDSRVCLVVVRLGSYCDYSECFVSCYHASSPAHQVLQCYAFNSAICYFRLVKSLSKWDNNFTKSCQQDSINCKSSSAFRLKSLAYGSSGTCSSWKHFLVALTWTTHVQLHL